MHTRLLAGLTGLALTLAASALVPKVAAAQDAASSIVIPTKVGTHGPDRPMVARSR